MHRSVLVVALLVPMLAGCLEQASDADRESPEDEPGLSAPMASFSETFHVIDCPDPFLFVAMDRDALQGYLPSGIVAGDAIDSMGGFFQILDRQDGRPRVDLSGLGAFLIQMVGCTGGHEPETDYDEALVGIFIEPPRVEGPRETASLDFYVLQHAVSTPWFIDLMAPTGWRFDGPEVDMIVDVKAPPDPHAIGRWSDETGAIYSVEMSAPAGPEQVAYKDILARFWQLLPGGIAHYDHTASGIVIQATELSCEATAGTLAAELLGSTDCSAPDRIHEGAILLGHDPTLSFHYLHEATLS